MLGILFTGWGIDGNGERLLAAMKGSSTDASQGRDCQTDCRHHQGRTEGVGRTWSGTEG